jgi:hypothetical protein
MMNPSANYPVTQTDSKKFRQFSLILPSQLIQLNMSQSPDSLMFVTVWMIILLYDPNEM